MYVHKRFLPLIVTGIRYTWLNFCKCQATGNKMLDCVPLSLNFQCSQTKINRIIVIHTHAVLSNRTVPDMPGSLTGSPAKLFIVLYQKVIIKNVIKILMSSLTIKLANFKVFFLHSMEFLLYKINKKYYYFYNRKVKKNNWHILMADLLRGVFLDTGTQSSNYLCLVNH